MSFNGSGVYTPPGSSFPAVAQTLIESTKWNNVINDIASALSSCITKDGQTTTTGTIPFATPITVAGTIISTSSSATALAIGPAGVTSPTFLVDASTASSVTGIKIKSAGLAAGVALSVISSGANENLTIDAKGSGTITLGGTSTGGITLTRAVTLSSTINKVTITAPATSATLTIADGKTLTASNTLALAGTDGTTMTFPTTSATIARTDAANTFTGDQTFASDIIVQGTDIYSGSTASNLTVAGGTISNGGKIDLFGSTHATNANKVNITASAGVTISNALIVSSITATTLTLSGDLQVSGGDIFGASNSGALTIAGGGAAGNGGQINLYGSTHATKANMGEFIGAGGMLTTTFFGSDTSATPGTLAATGMRLMANTTDGAVLHGYGTSYDVRIGGRTGGGQGAIYVHTNSNSFFNPGGIRIGTDGTNNHIFSASLGAGTATLYIGNASINVTSDIRVKTNIQPTTRDAWDLTDRIQVVDHLWDDPSDKCENNRNSRGLWMGLIAQQVVDVTPWAVNAPDRNCTTCRAGNKCDEHNSLWHVEREHHVPLLIRDAQITHSRIRDHEARLKALEARH